MQRALRAEDKLCQGNDDHEEENDQQMVSDVLPQVRHVDPAQDVCSENESIPRSDSEDSSSEEIETSDTGSDEDMNVPVNVMIDHDSSSDSVNDSASEENVDQMSTSDCQSNASDDDLFLFMGSEISPPEAIL